MSDANILSSGTGSLHVSMDWHHDKISTRPSTKQVGYADNRSDRNVPLGQHAASAHNMLRNDTEIGLSGQYSVKPAYKSLEFTKNEPFDKGRVRQGSREHNPKSENIPGLSDTRPSDHMRETNGHLASSVSASPHPRPRHLTQPQHLVRDGSGHLTTTHKLYKGHVVNRPHAQSPNHQHRGIPSHGRPRSPLAYPTRLKRPGYRPSSPAWSDTNFAAYRTTFGSRPSSPLSIQSLGRIGSPWAQQTNHSDPTLMHFPPFLVQGKLLRRQDYSSLSRTSTPRPAPSLRSAASSSQMAHPNMSQSSLRSDNFTSTEPPLFYDYSEGFEDSGPKVDKQVSEYTEQRRLRSPTPKASTPTLDCLVRPSLSRASVRVTMGREPKNDQDRLPIGDILRCTDVVKGAVTGSDGEASPSKRISQIQISSQASTNSSQSEAWATANDDTNNGMIVYVHRDLKDESSSNTRLHNGSATTDKQPLILPTRDIDRISSTDSMETAESSSRKDVDTDLDEPHQYVVLSGPQTDPSVRTEQTDDLGSLRTLIKVSSTGEDLAFSDSSTIISPTPERSILSDASRHRFSNILGIDDPILMKRRPGKNISLFYEGIEYGDPGSSGGPNRQEVVQIDEHATSPSMLDDSDSDGGPKLSASLLRTFGRYTKVAEDKERSTEDHHTVQQTTDTFLIPSDKIQDTPPTSSQTSLGLMEDKTKPSAILVQAFLRPNGPNKNRHAHIFAPFVVDHPERERDLATNSESQRAIIAIPPPVTKNRRSLPFAFSPLNVSIGEETMNSAAFEVTSDLEDGMTSVNDSRTNLEIPFQKDVDKASDSVSIASSRASRPWNRDSNYPWNDECLQLDVAVPQENRQTPSPIGRFPKFKLRIHRASTSSAGTGQHTKSRSSSDGTASFSRSSSQILRSKAMFNMRPKPRLGVGPLQENSSHVLGNDTFRSRFVESFDSPPRVEIANASPAINLVEASPAHEVRSFFSDDSSRVRQKATLRKRLSEFRTRHAQANSTEDVRGHDRGLLNAAFGRSRASGRTSRQSQTTGGESRASGLRRPRSRMLRQVQFWWQRNENRLRTWKWTMHHKRHRHHTTHHTTQDVMSSGA